MAAVAPSPLTRIRREPYPAHLLDGCETGLCLFAAAFLGRNDAIHYADAGLVTTCVDRDGGRLRRMSRLYPDGWSFVEGDAWLYARTWSGGRQWDAVSVDTFTGEAEARSLASLPLWCSLARRVVTVTATDGAHYEVPEGWRATVHPRSTRVFWLVMQHG